MGEETIKKCKILFGCFFIQLLIAGAGRLSSIYFVESIHRYDVDREQASLPFVLLYMMKNLAGPVVGYLEQILGIKWIIFLGCLLSTISIGCCFFAEDILVITMLWGVLLGLSFGFAYNMQAALLNQHFIKNKNKANAFVTIGSSIGGILLPIIAVNFIHTYGTSGSFLVLSAIVAHSIPASLLLENFSTGAKPSISKENADLLNENGIKNTESLSNITKTVEYPYLEESPICLSNSTKNVSYRDINSANSSMKKNFELLAFNSSSKIILSQANCKKQSKPSESSFRAKKFTLRNFRIFIDPTFIVILIIHGLNISVIVVVWTVILDFVRDKNVPENLEIYYVILLPITDIIGRLISGYISDKNFLTFSKLSFITFLIKAITLIAIIHVNNSFLLMAFEILLSICIGCTIVQQVTMTEDFMEEDLKKMSQSCRFMLSAPLSLTVSPMLGYFRGDHGSYDAVFYILSAASLCCGLFAYLLPYLSRRRPPENTSDI